MSTSSPGPATRRMPVLALGAACLLLGLTGGLARIGAGTPTPASAAAGHGVLMTLGFLGTLITLERAVALRRWWGYAAPVLSGLGSLALVAGVPAPVPQLVIAAGGAWLTATYLAMWQIQPALHVAIQALGALAWWGGALRWLAGADLPTVAPWLAAFIVLTIAGERVELARVAFVGGRRRDGVALSAVLVLAGPAVAILAPDVGARILGVGLLVLSAWLARHDIARRTIRGRGLTRYMAACLLAGYVWLAAAGLLWTWQGAVVDGPAYDATLHSVFLGFAMSMVLGHAPVILPAVLRVRLPHHRRDYAVLALLHASLLLRLVAGDALGITVLRITGGVLGAVALLAFVGSSAAAVLAARPSPRASQPSHHLLEGESR